MIERDKELLLVYNFPCPHCKARIRQEIYSAVGSNGKPTADVVVHESRDA